MYPNNRRRMYKPYNEERGFEIYGTSGRVMNQLSALSFDKRLLDTADIYQEYWLWRCLTKSKGREDTDYAKWQINNLIQEASGEVFVTEYVECSYQRESKFLAVFISILSGPYGVLLQRLCTNKTLTLKDYKKIGASKEVCRLMKERMFSYMREIYLRCPKTGEITETILRDVIFEWGAWRFTSCYRPTVTDFLICVDKRKTASLTLKLRRCMCKSKLMKKRKF